MDRMNQSVETSSFSVSWKSQMQPNKQFGHDWLALGAA
jgi:hypothetical protein